MIVVLSAMVEATTLAGEVLPAPQHKVVLEMLKITTKALAMTHDVNTQVALAKGFVAFVQELVRR